MAEQDGERGRGRMQIQGASGAVDIGPARLLPSGRPMLKRVLADKTIVTMLLGVIALGTAYGVASTLAPLFLNKLQFTTKIVGITQSLFAAGIVAGSIPMGAAVRKFSARTVLVVCLIGYTLVAAVFPLFQAWVVPSPDGGPPASVLVPMLGFGGDRFLDGFFSAGVFVSCETILLGRSDPSIKAFVMSLYAMMLALGYGLGAGLAKLLGVQAYAFFVSAGLSLVSIVVLLFKLEKNAEGAAAHHHDHGPATGKGGAPPHSSLAILWKIKTCCFGTFSYGYFQSAAQSTLAIYMTEQGLAPAKEVPLMTACFAGGMLVFSNPIARLADRRGHLGVVRVLAIVGTLMVGAIVFAPSWTAVLVIITVAGACIPSISPIMLALQGHILPPRDYARANAIYNTFYAVGMLLGPFLSAAVYDASRPALLWHMVGLWAAFALFTTVFYRDDPRARGERGHFPPEQPGEGGAVAP